MNRTISFLTREEQNEYWRNARARYDYAHRWDSFKKFAHLVLTHPCLHCAFKEIRFYMDPHLAADDRGIKFYCSKKVHKKSGWNRNWADRYKKVSRKIKSCKLFRESEQYILHLKKAELEKELPIGNNKYYILL